MIFSCERIYLRPLTQHDFADLCEILQDPEVVYAYEHTFSDADVRQWLERQQSRYRDDGFGLWAVCLKDGGRMIGQAGLTRQKCEAQSIVEIGYLLKKAYWCQGYASEAAAGCRDYAFHTLRLPAVYSIIKSDNYSSQRVAERLGMRKQKEFLATFYNGPVPHILYGMENPADITP